MLRLAWSGIADPPAARRQDQTYPAQMPHCVRCVEPARGACQSTGIQSNGGGIRVSPAGRHRQPNRLRRPHLRRRPRQTTHPARRRSPPPFPPANFLVCIRRSRSRSHDRCDLPTPAYSHCQIEGDGEQCSAENTASANTHWIARLSRRDSKLWANWQLGVRRGSIVGAV